MACNVLEHQHWTKKTVYVLQDPVSKLYWIWSYSSKEFAEKMAQKVEPDTTVDRAVNWKADPNDTCLSSRIA